MQNSGWTIICLAFDAPNRLSVALRSLIRYSSMHHNIILVWSDKNKILNDPEARRTLISDHQDTREFFYKNQRILEGAKYNTVQEFVEKNKQWLSDHDIVSYELTEEDIAFRKQYLRKEITGIQHREGHGYDFRYVDVSFHINRAIEIAPADWFYVTWDDDEIASPGWDIALHEVTKTFGKQFIYTPTTVLYWPFWTQATLPPYQDPWEDLRQYNQNSIFYTGEMISEEQWISFVQQTRKNAIYKESCGDRIRSPALPHLISTELARLIGPHTYSGAANDIEIDDRCRDKFHLEKISCCNSLIGHKIPISYSLEQI